MPPETFSHKAFRLSLTIVLIALSFAPSFAASSESQVLSRELRSENFANNNIGTSPVRKTVVYLPAGYDGSSKRYPVIYFLPDAFEGYRAPFEQHHAQSLFDKAIA